MLTSLIFHYSTELGCKLASSRIKEKLFNIRTINNEVGVNGEREVNTLNESQEDFKTHIANTARPIHNGRGEKRRNKLQGWQNV